MPFHTTSRSPSTAVDTRAKVREPPGSDDWWKHAAIPQFVPDPNSGPQAPQGTALQHRQQHSINDDEARRPIVNVQPVPGELCYQLVWKQEELHKKLCPLSPTGLQLTNKVIKNHEFESLNQVVVRVIHQVCLQK